MIDVIGDAASFGATGHHMMFSYNYVFAKWWMGKVNPPLRDDRTQKDLWQAYVDGRIPILESDHAPHTIDEKTSKAPSGMPEVGTLLPLMLYKVKHHNLPLSVLHDTVCTNPAALFGLRKGRIEVGWDAALVVVDFDNESNVTPLSKCGWSAYDGWPCIYPTDVYLRGNRIVEGGRYVGTPGQGTMVAGAV